jgi:DivIVA domain-containing protein
VYNGNNEKILLTTQDILDKEFKVDARGYRPQDVDKFLDMVIADYTEFNAIIKKQEREIKALTEDNIKLKQEYHKLRGRLDAAADDDGSRNSVNNVDLLRRISQLEKVVFGKNE